MLSCLKQCPLCLNSCKSQCPRGLRRWSAPARLLGLWFRIPPGHGCLSVVSVVCCQVEVAATSWSLVQRSPIECDASLCVICRPQDGGGHGPQWAAAPQENKTYLHFLCWPRTRQRNSVQLHFTFRYDPVACRNYNWAANYLSDCCC